jgi:hypothetical protein
MDGWKEYWAQCEEEEQEKKRWRKFKELCDEHWESRPDSNFSPLIFLAVVLLLMISFILFAYGFFRANSSKPVQIEAVQPPAAPQGHPPQNTTRRARKQAAPANQKRK